MNGESAIARYPWRGTSYAYDARNRLTSIHAQHTATNALVQSYAFTNSETGNRTRIDEGDGTARVYGYDELSRLTSETVTGGAGPNYAKQFSYDAVGNRSTEVTTGGGPGVANFSYDSRDRLLDGNSAVYASDANGNLLSGSGEATYAFDTENRLVSVALADGTIVTHEYDFDGNRVCTIVTPGGDPSHAIVTRFLVDTCPRGACNGGLSHVVAETDGNAALSALYVRMGDEMLAVIRPTVGGAWLTRWVHHDGIGSVRVLTDEGGGPVDVRSYEAFGAKNAGSGNDPLTYGFAGEALDTTSALAFHRARWVDSRTGRFLSIDPLAALPTTAQGSSAYIYADDNPVSRRDPTGLFNEGGVGGISSPGATAATPYPTIRPHARAGGGLPPQANPTYDSLNDAMWAAMLEGLSRSLQSKTKYVNDATGWSHEDLHSEFAGYVYEMPWVIGGVFTLKYGYDIGTSDHGFATTKATQEKLLKQVPSGAILRSAFHTHPNGAPWTHDGGEGDGETVMPCPGIFSPDDQLQLIGIGHQQIEAFSIDVLTLYGQHLNWAYNGEPIPAGAKPALGVCQDVAP